GSGGGTGTTFAAASRKWRFGSTYASPFALTAAMLPPGARFTVKLTLFVDSGRIGSVSTTAAKFGGELSIVEVNDPETPETLLMNGFVPKTWNVAFRRNFSSATIAGGTTAPVLSVGFAPSSRRLMASWVQPTLHT